MTLTAWIIIATVVGVTTIAPMLIIWVARRASKATDPKDLNKRATD